MTEPQVSLRVEGERLSPSQGLSNLINISIDTKYDEILVNPTTGSHTLSGRTLRISPPVVVDFNLHSTNPSNIRQLLRTKLSTSFSWKEFLASHISMAATNLGFGLNGFVVNIFLTITYYHHTIELPPSDSPSPPPPENSDNDTEEIYRMVLLGRIKREELKSLKSLKSETDTCSICLENLTGSNSKHGLTRMTCSHVFHDRCLLEWLRRKNSCPLCRSVLYNH